MITIINNNKLVVQELEKRKLYKLLTSQPKTTSHGVFILGDFKTRLVGDVFIYHYGYEQAKDNGFSWLHFDGTEAERRSLISAVLDIAGDNASQLIGIDWN